MTLIPEYTPFEGSLEEYWRGLDEEARGKLPQKVDLPAFGKGPELATIEGTEHFGSSALGQNLIAERAEILFALRAQFGKRRRLPKDLAELGNKKLYIVKGDSHGSMGKWELDLSRIMPARASWELYLDALRPHVERIDNNEARRYLALLEYFSQRVRPDGLCVWMKDITHGKPTNNVRIPFSIEEPGKEFLLKLRE